MDLGSVSSISQYVNRAGKDADDTTRWWGGEWGDLRRLAYTCSHLVVRRCFEASWGRGSLNQEKKSIDCCFLVRLYTARQVLGFKLAAREGDFRGRVAREGISDD